MHMRHPDFMMASLCEETYGSNTVIKDMVTCPRCLDIMNPKPEEDSPIQIVINLPELPKLTVEQTRKLYNIPEMPKGVWFVYGWDQNAYPVGVFADELEARRSMDTFHQVIFWPFGISFDQLEGR